MSGGLEVLSLKEDDVKKFLAAEVHIGDANVNFQMASYIYKTRNDRIPIINIKKTWEKLLLAARIISAIENPADVCILSNRTVGQRGILKYAVHTGATAVAGRFTPGTFTNQIQKAFKEPRLLIVCDPRTDHQSVTEASYVNIPVIALCNTSTPLKNIDLAIPCNNNGKHSLGLMLWMLAREVLRLRGTISRDYPWDIMPDLYFYREPEEIEKEEQAKIEEVAEWPAEKELEPWTEPTTKPTTDWAKETGTIQQPAAIGDSDWITSTTTTKEWGEEDAGDWKEPTTGETAW